MHYFETLVTLRSVELETQNLFRRRNIHSAVKICNLHRWDYRGKNTYLHNQIHFRKLNSAITDHWQKMTISSESTAYVPQSQYFASTWLVTKYFTKLPQIFKHL